MRQPTYRSYFSYSIWKSKIPYQIIRAIVNMKKYWLRFNETILIANYICFLSIYPSTPLLTCYTVSFQPIEVFESFDELILYEWNWNSHAGSVFTKECSYTDIPNAFRYATSHNPMSFLHNNVSLLKCCRDIRSLLILYREHFSDHRLYWTIQPGFISSLIKKGSFHEDCLMSRDHEPTRL